MSAYRKDWHGAFLIAWGFALGVHGGSRLGDVVTWKLAAVIGLVAFVTYGLTFNAITLALSLLRRFVTWRPAA